MCHMPLQWRGSQKQHMTIELHAFSSSATGLPAAGQHEPSTTCTLTFHHRVDGIEAERSVLTWTTAAAQPVQADAVEVESTGASTLRRRSLTITY